MDPSKKQDVEEEKFLEDILKPEYYDILVTEDCFDTEINDNIVLGYN